MTLAILHNEQRIEQLPNRDYISFSAISSYQSCPLKFKFRYMDQLPEDAVSAALVFGGAIHNAVEFHFNELMAGNTAPDLDTLLDVYQDAWRNRDDATSGSVKATTRTRLAVLPNECCLCSGRASSADPVARSSAWRSSFAEVLFR